jgi:hypothetical protein
MSGLDPTYSGSEDHITAYHSLYSYQTHNNITNDCLLPARLASIILPSTPLE